jgi:hypothetical protein
VNGEELKGFLPYVFQVFIRSLLGVCEDGEDLRWLMSKLRNTDRSTIKKKLEYNLRNVKTGLKGI